MNDREILFRGKSLQSKEWIYGNFKLSNNKTYINKWNQSWDDGCWLDTDIPVYWGTVGQYTGLKDKNGKRIFEGDILQVYDDTDVPMFLCKVEYCDKHHYPAFEIEPVYWEDEGNNLQILVLGLEDCYCRVIGNVFDNPELLEDANE